MCRYHKQTKYYSIIEFCHAPSFHLPASIISSIRCFFFGVAIMYLQYLANKKPAEAGYELMLVTDFEMRDESPSLGGAWLLCVESSG